MCARFTHPGENILFKGLAGLLPKAEKVIFGHVHSLPSLQNLLHLRLFDAFCVKFQSAQQAQNLFLPCTIILHALQKTRARTLHTLLANDTWRADGVSKMSSIVANSEHMCLVTRMDRATLKAFCWHQLMYSLLLTQHSMTSMALQIAHVLF